MNITLLSVGVVANIIVIIVIYVVVILGVNFKKMY